MASWVNYLSQRHHGNQIIKAYLTCDALSRFPSFRWGGRCDIYSEMHKMPSSSSLFQVRWSTLKRRGSWSTIETRFSSATKPSKSSTNGKKIISIIASLNVGWCQTSKTCSRTNSFLIGAKRDRVNSVNCRGLHPCLFVRLSVHRFRLLVSYTILIIGWLLVYWSIG